MTDMNTIEIVSHCWAGHLPIYAHLLRAQALSLISHNRSHCRVIWSVFYVETDAAVVEVLEEVETLLMGVGVELLRFTSTVEEILQRSIGRNIAAVSTGADCVWFTDCDYMFAGLCLDEAVRAAATVGDSIIYPNMVQVCSHEAGDALIAKMARKEPLELIDFTSFQPRPETKAIGGIQIVSGALARSKGYLDGTKWMQPVTKTDRGSFNTVTDVKYRKAIGKCVPWTITSCRRIRHSARAYGGTVIEQK